MERRRIRAIRNILAAVLLLVFFWWTYRCPLPTSEMQFRRYERQMLAERSSIVFSCESEGEVMLVGVAEGTVHTYSPIRRPYIWPKNPSGSTLVVLPAALAYRDLTMGLVAVEPPALAERAVLTLLFDGSEAAVTAAGERREAVFLFRLEETEDLPYAMLKTLFYTTALPPYTLEFYSGDGTLLETVTNIT